MKINDNKKLLIYLLALMLLAIFSIAIFTWHVLYMYLVAIATAFVVEFAFAKIRKKEINFIHWFQTPLLFVLFLPSQTPLEIVLFGSAFAVFFGKAVFGGDDKYVFNPAIVGMLFVTVSFPNQLATWFSPADSMTAVPSTADLLFGGKGLGVNVASLGTYTFRDLLIASPGTVGEVFRLLILVLGVLLIIFKVIDWKIPLSFLVSYFLFTLFGNMTVNNFNLMDAIMPLFVGTVMLSAFFVATDEPTAAKYPLGRIIYGIGFGFFTFLIRSFSDFTDGIIFVIIIMNTLAPLIDRIEVNKYVTSNEVEVGANHE